MHKSTIRNVATSQRRNVATSQRRDISTGSALHNFKHEWFGMRGYWEAYERGHGIPEQSDTDFEEVPGICIVSHFLLDIRMMFLILIIVIFSFSMF